MRDRGDGRPPRVPVLTEFVLYFTWRGARERAAVDRTRAGLADECTALARLVCVCFGPAPRVRLVRSKSTIVGPSSGVSRSLKKQTSPSRPSTRSVGTPYRPTKALLSRLIWRGENC